MKYRNLLVLFFLLCGCQAGPKFYDGTQDIRIFSSPNTTIKIGDNTLIAKDAEKELGHAYAGTIKTKRSFWSISATISKDGFQDKTIEIESKLTDDQWAEREGMFGGVSSTSAFFLLPPFSTVSDTCYGIVQGPRFVGADPYHDTVLGFFGAFFGGIGGFVYGIGHDIYNTLYGIPAATIMNPWYEYDHSINLSMEILEPTNEFLENCHKDKENFIGNNSCLNCQINEKVISTQEECNRCPNREWTQSLYCSLKKNQN